MSNGNIRKLKGGEVVDFSKVDLIVTDKEGEKYNIQGFSNNTGFEYQSESLKPINPQFKNGQEIRFPAELEYENSEKKKFEIIKILGVKYSSKTKDNVYTFNWLGDNTAYDIEEKELAKYLKEVRS